MKVFAMNRDQETLIQKACNEVNAQIGDPKYIKQPGIWHSMDDFSMIIDQKGQMIPCTVMDSRLPLSFGSIVGHLYEFPQSRYQVLNKLLQSKGYLPMVKPIWVQKHTEDGAVIESAHGFVQTVASNPNYAPVFSGRIDDHIHIEKTHLQPGEWGDSKDRQDLFYLPFRTESDVIQKALRNG